LKPIATPGVGVGATTGAVNSPRRVAAAGLPVFLLVLWAAASCVGRTTLESRQQKVGGTSAANARQAKATAGSFMSYITEDTVSPDKLQFSELSAYSPHRNRYVGDWNVVYGAATDHQYLIRLNAATRQIYAINRTREASAVAHQPTEESMTEEAARALALRYLGRLGNDVDSLRLSRARRTNGRPGYTEPNNSQSYVFFYRRETSGGKERFLLVAIDRSTGGLNYYWNPSAAI
jgi:hypothetical protein